MIGQQFDELFEALTPYVAALAAIIAFIWVWAAMIGSSPMWGGLFGWLPAVAAAALAYLIFRLLWVVLLLVFIVALMLDPPF